MNIVYNGEMDSRAFKEILGTQLQALAQEDPDVIYLDADLMSCIGTAKWAMDSSQGVNCGIAEANMAGVAAGLSASGFKPYIHSFGPFASRRCYDQVYLSAGYAGNPITVIGSDPGVCAAFNGGTHMPFEDMALYRAMPGSTVLDIADCNQLISVLRQVKDMDGVKYIRVGRKNCAKIYEDGADVPIGKGVTLREGKDAAVFATGIMIHEAFKAAETLSKEGIEIAIIDMFTVKPLDEACVVRYAQETGAVVTAENHNKIGGLYSAVCEALAAHGPVPVEYVAVEDVFGEVGPQDYLQKRFGLTAEHIAEKVRAALARKK